MTRRGTFQRWPDDRPLPWRLHLGVVVCCLVALGILFGIGSSPAAVERLYVDGLGGRTSSVVSRLTGLVPFSLAELVELLLIGWLLLAPVPALLQVKNSRRRLRNAVASGALQVASVGSVVLVLFYGLWGLNYARDPAVARLGWEPVRLDDPEALEELTTLAEELVERTNAQYLLLHGKEDAGVPSPRASTEPLDAVFDRSYARVAADLGLEPTFTAPRGPAKPLISSPVFSWLGISGFYFPFTGEANYNTLPPGWQQPHTIAHEKAHQRGIASEDEANFYGFLACVHADDPYVAYSGWLFAQRKLLSTLLRSDREAAKELLARRLPGVQRDVDASAEFWSSWDGYGHVLGSTVNDAYLKTNRVEGGIRSYSLSARLIVAWARSRGGTFDASDAAAPEEAAPTDG